MSARRPLPAAFPCCQTYNMRRWSSAHMSIATCGTGVGGRILLYPWLLSGASLHRKWPGSKPHDPRSNPIKKKIEVKCRSRKPKIRAKGGRAATTSP